jgi:hypothetical protein
VKHVPVRLNEGPDGVSRRPRGEGESEPEEEDDLEETIEASLRGIWVEQGSDRNRRQRPYKPFVDLRLAEEYNERRYIAWTMTKRVEHTESTQLREIARWRQKKYSYWLSCTHVTPKNPINLP